MGVAADAARVGAMTISGSFGGSQMCCIEVTQHMLAHLVRRDRVTDSHHSKKEPVPMQSECPKPCTSLH